jgi:hypothetical protein
MSAQAISMGKLHQCVADEARRILAAAAALGDETLSVDELLAGEAYRWRHSPTCDAPSAAAIQRARSAWALARAGEPSSIDELEAAGQQVAALAVSRHRLRRAVGALQPPCPTT